MWAPQYRGMLATQCFLAIDTGLNIPPLEWHITYSTCCMAKWLHCTLPLPLDSSPIDLSGNEDTIDSPRSKMLLGYANIRCSLSDISIA